jgi:hypothetical protein
MFIAARVRTRLSFCNVVPMNVPWTERIAPLRGKAIRFH